MQSDFRVSAKALEDAPRITSGANSYASSKKVNFFVTFHHTRLPYYRKIKINDMKRLNLIEKGSSVMKPLFGVKKHLDESTVGKELVELISFRVSQMNGCPVCLEMHSKELLAKGESARRLLLLNAWRETPLFSERERAALDWAEALTLLDGNSVPDSIYEEAARHFTETEMIDLALAVGFINVANRLNIAFETPIGYNNTDQIVSQLAQTG